VNDIPIPKKWRLTSKNGRVLHCQKQASRPCPTMPGEAERDPAPTMLHKKTAPDGAAEQDEK
jgi:hypothetical protein